MTTRSLDPTGGSLLTDHRTPPTWFVVPARDGPKKSAVYEDFLVLKSPPSCRYSPARGIQPWIPHWSSNTAEPGPIPRVRPKIGLYSGLAKERRDPKVPPFFCSITTGLLPVHTGLPALRWGLPPLRSHSGPPEWWCSEERPAHRTAGWNRPPRRCRARTRPAG